MSDELTRNARLQKVFKALEDAGTDGKQVLKDLLTIQPEELLKNKRAMDLLHEWLTKEELKEFIEQGELTIKSALYENRVYKISRGRYDLTHVLEDGKHTQDLCVHAINNEELPYGDSILTKIMALKTDEHNFLANSNVRQLIAQEYTPPSNLPQHTTMGQLMAQYQLLTPEQIGRVSLPPMPHSVPEALVKKSIRLATAQAMLDGISSTPEGMVVRGLLPHLDFRTTKNYVSGGWHGNESQAPEHWRQPAEGMYEQYSTEFEAYKTNINCQNDRKVYVLYGLMNLLPSERNVVSHVTIIRGHVRTIDIINTSHINQVDCIIFAAPMLFQRCMDFSIRFGLNDEAKGRFSRIMSLGCVAEAFGMNIA